MFSQPYNILESCDREEALILAKLDHLARTRLEAELYGWHNIHKFTRQALDCEYAYLLQELNANRRMRMQTPVLYASTFFVQGGVC